MLPRRKKLLKRLILAVILLIAAGFFLSSSFFLTGVVLPAVRGLTGLELYIGKIDWRPWSGRLTVLDFRLGGEDETFLRIQRAQGYYDLRECVRGIISFYSVDAAGVDLHFSQDATGRWNYRKLLRVRPRTEIERPARPVPVDSRAVRNVPVRVETPGAPEWLQFNLRHITIRDSRLSLTTQEQKRRYHCSWSELNIGSDRFQNGAEMPLQATGKLYFDSDRALKLSSQGTLSANVSWGKTLLPDLMNLRFRLDSLQGNLDSVPMDGSTLTVALNSSYKDGAFDVPMLRIDQTKLQEQRSILRAAGKWRLNPLALSVQLHQAELAPEPLALISDLFFGINPGLIRFYGNGKLDCEPGQLSTSGRWTLIRNPGPAIFGTERMDVPGFRIDAEQDFAVAENPRRIDFQKLQLTLTETNRTAIKLSLRHPVKYQIDSEVFDGTLPGLDLSVEKFDLKLLRFLLPSRGSFQLLGGSISGKAGLDFARQFGDTALHGDFRIDGGAFRYADFELGALDSTLQLDASVNRLPEFRLHQLLMKFYHEKKELAVLSLNGSYFGNDRHAEAQIQLDGLRADNKVFTMRNSPLLPLCRLMPEFRAGISAAVRYTPEQLVIQNCAVLFTDEEEARINAVLQPQTIDLRTGRVLGDWRASLNATLPLTDFNRLLDGNDLRFEKGELQLNSRLNGGEALENVTFDGTLQLTDAALRWQQFLLRDLSVNNDFSCYFPQNGRQQLNANQTYVRIAGHPALRFESRGTCDAAGGKYEGTVSVRYINERVANLFYPDLLEELAANGSLQFQSAPSAFRLTGQLAASKIRRPNNPRAFAAGIDLDCRRDAEQDSIRKFSFFVTEKERSVAQFQLADETAADRQLIRYTAASKFIDVGTLLELLQAKPAAIQAAEEPPRPAVAAVAAAAAAPQEPPQKKETPPPHEPIHFGQRPIRLELTLDELSFSPELKSSLRGALLFRGQRMHTQNLELTINRALLPLSLHFSDSAEGPSWMTSGELRGTLDLAPVIRFIEPGYQVQGKLSALSWNIFANQFRQNPPLGSVTGRLGGAVSSIVVENRAVRGPVARLLLLPIEAVFRFNALIPTSVNVKRQWQMFRNHVLTTDNPLSKFRFDTGEFELRALDGKLEIDRLQFTGPVISSLSFTGDMGLAGDLALRFVSRVDAGGVQVNMPINGTLQRPEINLSDLELALTGVHLKEMIGKVAAIIPGVETKSGGEESGGGFSLWRQIRSLWGGSGETKGGGE